MPLINLSRHDYKVIKSMDRQQMEAYLSDLYHRGWNGGVDKAAKDGYDKGFADAQKQSAAGVYIEDFMSKVRKAVENTKGIGGKRAADIIDNIEQELKNTSGGEVMLDQYKGCDIVQVDEHVEIRTEGGEFVSSADTVEEAKVEIDQYEADMNAELQSHFEADGNPID